MENDKELWQLVNELNTKSSMYSELADKLTSILLKEGE